MTNKFTIFLVLTFMLTLSRAQVNKVANPSFENKIDCNVPVYISKAVSWNNLDSLQPSGGAQYYNVCNFLVPSNAFSEQYARTGNAYMLTQLFCQSPSCAYPYFRGYTKNRLTTTLTAGKVYCAKMYVNSVEKCLYGIDAIQMYFGDVTLDTIKYCYLPLTYLSPQVKNTTFNIITDTVNWIQVSSTFTATGNEKYLVIGNFETDANTNKTAFNTGYPLWAGYNIDDVSVIEFNLSASAGPDKNINLGDSAFIGIPPEVGLECTWTSGSFTVGAGGGLWVKPTSPGTYSYVVTQNICGNIKTDTVNVNVSPSLINEHAMFSQSIGLFPQPANDIVKLTFRNYSDERVSIEILDTNGKAVFSKNESIKNNSTVIPTDNLSNGIYYLKIRNSKDQFATKKLTVTH